MKATRASGGGDVWWDGGHKNRCERSPPSALVVDLAALLSAEHSRIWSAWPASVGGYGVRWGDYRVAPAPTHSSGHEPDTAIFGRPRERCVYARSHQRASVADPRRSHLAGTPLSPDGRAADAAAYVAQRCGRRGCTARGALWSVGAPCMPPPAAPLSPFRLPIARPLHPSPPRLLQWLVRCSTAGVIVVSPKSG